MKKMYPWSFEAYGNPIEPPAGKVRMLTPISTINTIAQGYVPEAITIATALC